MLGIMVESEGIVNNDGSNGGNDRDINPTGGGGGGENGGNLCGGVWALLASSLMSMLPHVVVPLFCETLTLVAVGLEGGVPSGMEYGDAVSKIGGGGSCSSSSS